MESDKEFDKFDGPNGTNSTNGTIIEDVTDNYWYKDINKDINKPINRAKFNREAIIDQVYQFILERFTEHDFELLLENNYNEKFDKEDSYSFLAFQLYTLEQMTDKNLNHYITLISIINNAGLYSLSRIGQKNELIRGFILNKNLHGDTICIFTY